MIDDSYCNEQIHLLFILYVYLLLIQGHQYPPRSVVSSEGTTYSKSNQNKIIYNTINIPKEENIGPTPLQTHNNNNCNSDKFFYYFK